MTTDELAYLEAVAKVLRSAKRGPRTRAQIAKTLGLGELDAATVAATLIASGDLERSPFGESPVTYKAREA